MESVIVIVAIMVMLSLGTRFSQFVKAASINCQLPYVFPAKGVDIPEPQRNFFRKASLPLRDLGFKSCGFIQQQSWEKQVNGRVYIAVFFNDKTHTYAWLHQSILPMVADPLVLQFISHYSNGSLVVTDNQNAICQPFRHQKIIEHSVSCENAEELYKAHEEHLEEFDHSIANKDIGPIVVKPEEITERFNNAWNADFETAKQNKYVAGSSDQYFISSRSAWNLLNQFIARNKAAARLLTKRNASAEARDNDFSNLITNEDILGPQVHMTEMHLSSSASKGRPIFAWITFGVSVLLFAVFFGLWLGWEIVPVLIFVVLLHELGHFYAMRLSGYSETSIFFIPGLGAAASGKAHSANYWQRIFVFLAGPLPGLVLAFLLWGFWPNPEPWLTSVIIMLIVINWLNLLPFMPLDGGQIIQLSLKETGRLVFGWFSAVGLLLLAWGLGEPVLWILGAYATWSAFIRQANFGLRRQLFHLSKEAVSETDFTEKALKLQQAPAYNAFDFNARLQLIKEFVEELHMPPVRFIEKAFGVVIYILSLSLPVVLFIILMFSAIADLEPAALPEKDWQLELEQIDDIHQSIDVALDAIDFHLEYYDLEQAEHFVSEAQVLMENEEVNQQKRAQLGGAELRLWAMNTSDIESSEQVISKIDDYLALAPERNQEWYEAMRLSILSLGSDIELKVDELEKMYLYLERQGDFSELARLYTDISYLYYEKGTERKKRRLLEKAVEVAPDDEKVNYQGELAIAYMNEANYSKAFEIYTGFEADEEFNYMVNHHAYAWAAFKVGNYQRAIEIYEASFDKSEGLGGWSIWIWLMGEPSYLDQIEFNARLNQLVVADKWRNQKEIDRIKKRLDGLANDLEEGSLEQTRKSFESQLGYDHSWYSDNARENLKVLNRYYPSGN